MLKTTITALSVTAAAAALVASAAAASAAPQHLPLLPGPAPSPAPVTAVTHLTDLPDGGNGSPSPYWADDTLTRVLSITQTGGTAGAYTFTAKLTDTGTFKAIKGAQTPNQGPGYAGDVVKSSVTGPMSGYADFTFTASELPSAAPNAGVPGFENDHGLVPTDSTSTWYELAFPAGTTFGGAGIGVWSWKYDATVKTVTFRTVWVWERVHHRWVRVKVLVPVVHVTHQEWTDASTNGAGDLAGDGNISG